MERKLLAALLCTLLMFTAASAQDGWELSGFADAAYTVDFASKANQFSFDQAEIDITRSVDDYLVLRIDLESNGQNIGTVEQGFMLFHPEQIENLAVLFGKFNAPMGFEALDAPDMYQYSHSLLFDYGLPTNLTGVRLDYVLSEQLSMMAWVVNDWDANAENNEVKTYGARFNFEAETFNVGASAILGLLDAAQNTNRTVFDVDAAFTGIDNLLVGGEFNMGTISFDIPNVDNSTWMGIMVMGNYTINDWLGFTLRYDMFMDNEDYVFGYGLMDGSGNAVGVTRSSLTLAPLFTLGDGMGALIEYRMDMANEDVFFDADGKPAGSNSMLAFEMTYTF